MGKFSLSCLISFLLRLFLLDYFHTSLICISFVSWGIYFYFYSLNYFNLDTVWSIYFYSIPYFYLNISIEGKLIPDYCVCPFKNNGSSWVVTISKYSSFKSFFGSYSENSYKIFLPKNVYILVHSQSSMP